MRFKWLAFGKRMEKGINQYHGAGYDTALADFNEALEINAQDFLARFWVLRTMVHLGRFDEAKKHATACLALRLDLEELIAPWQSAAEETGRLDEASLKKLDAQTDKVIAQYQNERKYSHKTMLKIVALTVTVLLGYLIILLMLTLSLEMFLASANVEKIGDLICIPLYSIVVLIYLYMYCCRYPPVITQNYWLRFKEWVKLLVRKEFLYLCVILLLFDGLIISIRISEPFTVNTIGKGLRMSATYLQYPVTLFLLDIILPISEEILYRGFIFSYTRQFHRYFAYLLTAGLFYYMHDPRANLVFYLGLFFAYSYEKCRTLAAPVLLHIQHNCTFSIFYLVVKYLL